MDLSGTQGAYVSQAFKNISHKDGLVQSKEFESCTFSKSCFRDCVFKHCAFRECVFRTCDLSFVHLQGCTFVNCRFEGCELIGVNWTDSAWSKARLREPVHFVDCALNHSVFIGLNLRGVTISKCAACDVDFTECDLTECDCRFTDFSESRFLHTNLTRADFTGVKNYAIAASVNTLKKTKFSLPEAMRLLYSLDIVLTDY